MYRYLLRRLLWMVPVLFLISVVTFVIMKVTPGGPFDVMGGERATPKEVLESLNRQYGLDEPVWKQYLTYIGLMPRVLEAGKPATFQGVLQGNLGPSYTQRGRTVNDVLFAVPKDRPWWESRFGRTVQLGFFAFILGSLVGIPLGIVAALNHNRWLDYTSLFGATFFVSTPSFVLAILLMLTFGLWLHVLPIVARSWGDPQSWLLPVFSLGIGLAAFTTRLTRATMLEVLRQDYIRTARAKGLRDQVVMVRHAVRNAMVPVATVLGPALAALLTGSFFIEHMFSFPGMGRQLVLAIGQRDYSMIMATTLIYAVIIAFLNLLVDLAYAWLDPRISYS
jgi:oligopeptide transport system permease protein